MSKPIHEIASAAGVSDGLIIDLLIKEYNRPQELYFNPGTLVSDIMRDRVLARLAAEKAAKGE